MNMLFAFSTAKDSNGGLIRNYALKYDNGFTNFLGRAMEVFVQLIYVMGVQLFALPAFWILDFIADPTALIDPLSDAYGNAVGKLTNIVPPEVIAVGTLGVLVFYILLDRTRNSRSLSDDMSRLGVGVVLSFIVWIAVKNPLAGIKWITDSVSGIIESFLGAGSPGESAASAYLAPLTQLINYGHVLDDACSAQWSQAMNSGTTPGCVDVGSTSPMDVAAALIGTVVAMVSFGFAIYMLIKFIQHFTFAVWSWFALMWVAALAIAKRRAFDGLGKRLASVVAHLIMVATVMLLALAGPIIVMQVLSNIGPDYIFITLLLMIVGYLALWFLSFVILRKHGPLADMLKLNATNYLNQNLGAPSILGNGSMRGDLGSPLARMGSMGQRYGVPGAGAVGSMGGRIMGNGNDDREQINMRGDDYVREATYRPNTNLPAPATATQLPSGQVAAGAVSSGGRKKPGKVKQAIIAGSGVAAGAAATATGYGVVVSGAASAAGSGAASKLLGGGKGEGPAAPAAGAVPSGGAPRGPQGPAGPGTHAVPGAGNSPGAAGPAGAAGGVVKGAVTAAAKTAASSAAPGAAKGSGAAGAPGPQTAKTPAGGTTPRPLPKTDGEARAAVARADNQAAGVARFQRGPSSVPVTEGASAEQEAASRAASELRARIPVGVSSYSGRTGAFTDGGKVASPPEQSGIGTCREIADSVREGIDLGRVERERMTMVAASQGVPVHVLMDPDDESGRLRFKVIGGENQVAPAR